jgi:hypothetical protein
VNLKLQYATSSSQALEFLSERRRPPEAVDNPKRFFSRRSVGGTEPSVRRVADFGLHA